MNTREIDQLLRGLGPYVGTYSWNNIPQLERHTCCVVNTHCDRKRGEHWVAYAYTSQLLFFDSYGQPPGAYLGLPTRVDDYNATRLQSDGTQTCGLWVCWYLTQLYSGRTMKEITARFTDDLYDNDLYITRMYRGQ